MKKKKYSLNDKKQYYANRAVDKKLTVAQRVYANNILVGIKQVELDFNPADAPYWERRQQGAKELIKQKVALRADYLREEKVGNKDYVQNRLENDRKIGYHKGQLLALDDKLKKKPLF